MFKDSAKAPTPDPAIGEAAKRQTELGEEWLAFSKEQFALSQPRMAELDALTKRVTEMQIGLAGDAQERARADRERYDTKFRPVEDQLIAEATAAGTQEKQNAAAAEAMADVSSAAAAARGTARREATAMGLNPDSGRFAGIERSGELGTALATTGAANVARAAERDRALALKSDVINLGRGLPVAATAGDQVAAGLGGTAVGINQSVVGQHMQAPGLMESGFRGGMAGISGGANTLTNLHSAEAGVFEADRRHNAANAAGFGNFLGGVAGLGASILTAPVGGTLLGGFLSDEEAKEDRVPVPAGRALEAVEALPVDTYAYKEGQGDEGRHVGPMAQDFQAETGRGDGRSIAVQDAVGLVIAAVKDVNAKVDRLSEQIAGLGGVRPGPRPAAAPVPLKKAA
jgi:hypothetical protein